MINSIHELRGQFHAHITYESSKPVETPKGWKNTIILLKKGDREQTDVMLTKYYVTGKAGIESVSDMMADLAVTKKVLMKAGCTVTRLKLEHESLPTMEPSKKFYRECHIKVLVPNDYMLAMPHGFVLSKNPMEVVGDKSTWFLNARYYHYSLEKVEELIDRSVLFTTKANSCCEVLEVKRETTIFDDNKILDEWWA